MQPLISPVDHESRHNSYRADDDYPVSENSPLLSNRFPQYNDGNAVRTSTGTRVVVGVLLGILLFGVIIGIYLLIEQSNAENVVPPMELALQLVSHSQWNAANAPPPATSPFKAHQVVAVQTDSPQCWNKEMCIKLLLYLKSIAINSSLPHHFLVSSNGQTFEALGWQRPSPHYEKSDLVVGFIGNFTDERPTKAQVLEATKLFDESVSLEHLEPSYSIIGKNTKYAPKYLYESLSRLPEWSSDLSDM